MFKVLLKVLVPMLVGGMIVNSFCSSNQVAPEPAKKPKRKKIVAKKRK